MRVDEWLELALGEVLEVKHGFAFKGKYFGQGGEKRLVTPGNFYERGGFHDRGPVQKSYDGPVPSGYVLKPGSLVVAMTEQSRGLLGSSAVVPDDGKTWLHNQRIGLVLPDSRSTDDRFIYYLLNDPTIRDQISATATGTKVRHTAPRRIAAVQARFPPLGTQRRIAAVLSAFDELIEINERRIELLEAIARSLYREWFVRFRFPGHEDVELVDSDVGLAPKGWQIWQLDDLASLRRQSTKPADEPEAVFEHFSIPAFDRGALPAVEPGSAIKSAKYRVEVESVLLSKINPKFPRVWFAQPRSVKAIASTEFLVWVGVDVSNAWLWGLFADETFRGRLVGSAGGTSTSHQRFQPQDVAGRSVAVAPATLLEAFDSVAGPALKQAASLREQSHQLAAIRDLLIPRLVTGRLDISDMDLGVLTPLELE